ncbi:MAG: hypothetical protein IKS92_13970, partial [Victivallales bacterium]|nr:hypothetical protein [Victivallales bacterium]
MMMLRIDKTVLLAGRCFWFYRYLLPPSKTCICFKLLALSFKLYFTSSSNGMTGLPTLFTRFGFA